MTNEADESISGLAGRVNRKRANEDSIGWLIEYVGRLLHWYPSFTLGFIWDELDMAQGWSYYNFAYLDDPMHKFAGITPRNAYQKQESDKLVDEAHKVWKEQK